MIYRKRDIEMNKKVKIIACVLIVVCVVVAICIGRYLRLKKNEDSKYSFDYIKNMIKEGNDENKYIHVRNEWFHPLCKRIDTFLCFFMPDKTKQCLNLQFKNMSMSG